MPVLIFERNASTGSGRRGTAGQRNDRERHYTIVGTDDENVAIAKTLDESPPEIGGNPRRDVSFDEVADGLWETTVTYLQAELVDLTQPGEESYSFDTGGATAHRTHAIEEVGFFGTDGKKIAAGSYGNAIGVQNDGSVDGVDVVIPQFQFQVTRLYEDSEITDPFVRSLILLTGRMNDGKFKHLEKGECLFLGAAGSKRGDEKWPITFHYAGQPNASSTNAFQIAGINITEKLGWDYVWVKYVDKGYTVGAAKVLGAEVSFAAVSRVYNFGNFNDLG